MPSNPTNQTPTPEKPEHAHAGKYCPICNPPLSRSSYPPEQAPQPTPSEVCDMCEAVGSANHPLHGRTPEKPITRQEVEENKSVGWYIDGDTVKQRIDIIKVTERIVGKLAQPTPEKPDYSESAKAFHAGYTARCYSCACLSCSKWLKAHGEALPNITSPQTKNPAKDEVSGFHSYSTEVDANSIPAQTTEPDINENTSDGYHTFKELYEFRLLYNAALFNEWAKQGLYNVHKSMKHSSGEEPFGGGRFIVTATLPTGQISNHYELKDWALFKVPDVVTADEWDGHTPADVAKRLRGIIEQKGDSNGR